LCETKGWRAEEKRRKNQNEQKGAGACSFKKNERIK